MTPGTASIADLVAVDSRVRGNDGKDVRLQAPTYRLDSRVRGNDGVAWRLAACMPFSVTDQRSPPPMMPHMLALEQPLHELSQALLTLFR